MEASDILLKIGVALAIGLLLGFERGWEVREQAEGTRIAGIRTFGIVGLFGGAVGLLSDKLGGWVFASAALALGALVTAAHFRTARTEHDQSITTVTALLAGFTLSALAGLGEMAPAGAAAVIVAALLGIKPELHGLLRKISREELLATIRLLLISVVVLPVLPDHGFGPYDALNPRRLWWMVVLVAALSYIGYVAVRIAGVKRGVLLTALFGGLSSSTAVALNMARLARDGTASRAVVAGGTVTASAVMFPRALVIAGIVAPDLVAPLAAAMLPACAVALLGAWWLFRHDDAAQDQGPTAERFATQNPLDLRLALQFGVLLAVIMFAARAAAHLFGHEAVIAVAAASGLADVDAITLSVADGASGGAFGPTIAVAAVCTAAAVNTVVKTVLVGAIGGWRAGAAVAVPMAAALAAGGASLWILLSS